MLKAYPVKALKDDFNLSGLKQDDLINDVLSSETNDSILSFGFRNFGYLHQNLYVFDYSGTVPRVINIAGSTIIDDITTHNIREINLTFDIEYSLFNPQSASQEVLIFRCPVKVIINNKHVIIRINILERNANSYYSHKVFTIGKDIEDRNIISRIHTAFGLVVNLYPLDITKGIKFLWEDNFIDAAYVKFKKSRSTTTESMDEEHTLKDNYPDVYNEITTTPLDKNVFRVKRDVDDYINTFAVEPRKGKLAFKRFPFKVDSLEKLLDLIISNN
ncbi:hypothetical protein [Flaviramulus basaltis]|nr:hypothetical protein [Flaviramulus basaltis]